MLMLLILCGLFFGVFTRVLRGCFMWIVILGIFGWVLRHDHELAREFWDSVDEACRWASDEARIWKQ